MMREFSYKTLDLLPIEPRDLVPIGKFVEFLRFSPLRSCVFPSKKEKPDPSADGSGSSLAVVPAPEDPDYDSRFTVHAYFTTATFATEAIPAAAARTK
jgi:hypothetical protein